MQDVRRGRLQACSGAAASSAGDSAGSSDGAAGRAPGPRPRGGSRDCRADHEAGEPPVRMVARA
eukprot:553063-Alexandrium_andersonii.AAC.1